MRALGDRYLLDTMVGRGGMAQVWRAHDRVLGRTVAIKLLPAGLTADRDSITRIRREALIAAKLCHQHVAAVHDYGEAVQDGQRMPYVVMEFVDGPTLAARIADEGPLAWPEAVRICAEVADALSEAHDQGLVHRDVKPSNVMLPPAGVKVVDFGVAAHAGQSAADTVGRIWGTVGYLPPEQLHYGEALPAGDVYALALVLYESLAGRPPWPATRVLEVLAQRRRQPVPGGLPSDGLPDDVVQLYRRCVAADPAERPTAGQVASVLHAAIGRAASPSARNRPRPTRPVTQMPTVPANERPSGVGSRKRRVAAMASAPVAAAVSLFAVQFWNAGTPDPAEAEPAVSASPAQVRCRAAYVSNRLADGSFTAELMVTNTGTSALHDWSVAFDLPKGQAITDIPRGRWSQDSGRVTVAAADRLRPGGTTAMSLHGRFDPVDGGVPAGFAVDGVECAPAVTRVVTSRTPLPAGPRRARHDAEQSPADPPAAVATSSSPGPSSDRTTPASAPTRDPVTTTPPAAPTTTPPSSTPPATVDPTTPAASPSRPSSPSPSPPGPPASADPDPPGPSPSATPSAASSGDGGSTGDGQAGAHRPASASSTS